MFIFKIIFAIIMILTISNCETSDGSTLGLCVWIIISFLCVVIYKKGEKVTKQERINNIKRFKNSEIYYNNYGEFP